MKTIILMFGLLFSICVSAQSKNKIIPVDTSILKLSGDTTEKVGKSLRDFDYVFLSYKNTNKTDTVLVHKDLYLDRKRKPKN
jgi:hypothetical protein